MMKAMMKKKWVVYAKRPFGGPEQVLAYLSRYNHRVAISDQRIVGIHENAKTVTFRYRDYADNSKKKRLTISIDEFIDRFRLHILPFHFFKIRHYGILLFEYPPVKGGCFSDEEEKFKQRNTRIARIGERIG